MVYESDPESEEADLGIASQMLVKQLSIRAAGERARNPEHPSIRCKAAGCNNWAEEAWFFCSRPCRDEYVCYHISAPSWEHLI